MMAAVVVLSGGLSGSFHPTAGSASPTSAPSPGTEQLAAARASLGSGDAPLGLLTGGLGALSEPSTIHSEASPSYLWQPVPNVLGGPTPRYFPNLVWDASDGYVLLYGGFDLSNGYVYSDTWTYLNGTWTNITSTTTGQPPPVWAASIAFDPLTQEVILFGGNLKDYQAYNETFAYHDHAWVNLTTTVGAAPSDRVAPGLVPDPAGDLLLYGGLFKATSFNDTWTFDGTHWSNVTTTAGTAAAFTGAPYLVDDAAGPGPVLFGLASESPSGGAPYFSAMFEYTAGAWQNLTASTPGIPGVAPNFNGAEVGYLPGPGAVVVYSDGVDNASGGVQYGPFTWEYVGGAWVNESVTAGNWPGTVIGGGSFVSPYDNAFVLLWGANGTGLGVRSAVWALVAPPVLSTSVSPGVVDVGVPIFANGSVAFGLGGSPPVWSFGDGTTVSGDSASHAYTAPGAHAVTFTETDLAGQTQSQTTAVQVNPLPVVSIVGPVASPPAGSTVGFAAIPMGGTPPFTFSWTLGNGNTSTSAHPTDVYATAGSYTVKVTVTDFFGMSATNSTTVSVVTAKSSPPTTTNSTSSGLDLTSGLGLALLLGIVALAVVAAVLGVLLARKGRGPRSPPTAFVPGPAAPPPSAGAPPPGSAVPPSPPPPP